MAVSDPSLDLYQLLQTLRKELLLNTEVDVSTSSIKHTLHLGRVKRVLEKDADWSGTESLKSCTSGRQEIQSHEHFPRGLTFAVQK